MKPHLQIALALVWREGEILIARRRADAAHLPNKWEFPGGKIEVGESPRNACVREAREEIGVEVEIIETRPVVEWDYAERKVTLHPFDCRVVSGQARALKNAEIRWCAPDDLMASDFPDANTALIAQIRR